MCFFLFFFILSKCTLYMVKLYFFLLFLKIKYMHKNTNFCMFAAAGCPGSCPFATLNMNMMMVDSLGKPHFFLVARPLRGGGVKPWPLRKKNFFEALKKSPQKIWLLSSREGP